MSAFGRLKARTLPLKPPLEFRARHRVNIYVHCRRQHQRRWAGPRRSTLLLVGAGANTAGMAEEMRMMSREGRAPRLVEPEEMRQTRRSRPRAEPGTAAPERAGRRGRSCPWPPSGPEQRKVVRETTCRELGRPVVRTPSWCGLSV